MPRPRREPLYELDGQWIGRVPHSRNLYHFWNDAGAGRTRWRSLGTSNLRDAQKKFFETVINGRPANQNTPLAIVLEKYFTKKTDGKPSAGVARSAGRKFVRFFGTRAKVRNLTPERQKEFVQSLIDQGFKLSYAARVMSVLNSAMECSGLKAPKIVYTEAQMVDDWGFKTSPVEAAYIPSDKECATIWNATMPDRLRRFLIISVLTACRPEAAVDLAPKQRIREAHTLALNPADRAQNKKYRPTVREPRALAAFLDKWESEGLDAFGGRFCGYATMEGVKSGFDRLAKRAGIPISPYSFRHKAATVLRRAKVPEEQINVQLGHRPKSNRTSRNYGEYDPTYLKEAARALDGWFLTMRRAAAGAAKSQDNHKVPEVAGQKAA